MAYAGCGPQPHRLSSGFSRQTQTGPRQASTVWQQEHLTYKTRNISVNQSTGFSIEARSTFMDGWSRTCTAHGRLLTPSGSTERRDGAVVIGMNAWI